MSKFLKVVQNKSQPEKAREISRTLGIRTASRYLAKRGYSVEMAVYILLGK